ncbi:MAG: endonuclease/exonuclease/phosphatase family protein [Bacteroidales bacterium]|nr:endonuclease/exonuclease/phosphatase family protein [Bacteroidales bacterium]
MKKSLLFILAFFWVFFVSQVSLQAQQRNFKVGCVAFYNLENLFDTINDPKKNDEEFLPNGANQWNSKKYLTKLERLAEAIESIGTDITPDGAAILGVSEIENKEVLLDLAAMPKLQKRNYQVIHYHSPDLRGVDVALLYQPKYFKPTGSKSYRLTVEGMPNFYTRDQLLVSGLFDGEEMHFIVNHWPSRRGGEKRSLPLRMAAAKLSRHIVDSLLAINPQAKIVVMGDLNDNPTNKSLIEGLNAKGTTENLQPGQLYNTMFAFYKKGIGSNAWRDTWSLFDQIIVSQGLLGKDFSTYKLFSARVHNKTELTQKSGRFKGYPLRTFAGGEYMGGYSDHFPTYIILTKEVH